MQIGFFYCTPPQIFTTITFRMRKYIIPLFLSLCPTMAPAITNAECQQLGSIQQCKQRGCGWYTSSNFNVESGCFACNNGQYNDLSHCSSLTTNACACKNCPSAPISQDDKNWWWLPKNTTDGLTENTQCQIHIGCNAGAHIISKDNKYVCEACSVKSNNNTYYFNAYAPSGTLSYDPTTDKYTLSANNNTCSQCGKNSKINSQGTGCTCYNGYHTSGSTNSDINNNTKDCVINQYTVTLHHTANYSEKIQKNHEETIQLTLDTNHTTDGHEFKGWASNANATTAEHSDGTTLTVTADAEWYAIWKAKKFTVTYKLDSNDQYITAQECTYGTECKVQNFTCNDETHCKGKYFAKWCQGISCRATYNVGDDISTISNGEDVTLTAKWVDCETGHYCTSGVQQECRAGTYADEIGLSNCKSCPAGYYCPDTGMTTPTICECGKCCENENTTAPTTCPTGYYCEAGATSCTQNQCTEGQNCPAGSCNPTQCPAGYYCPDGTEKPCPAGSTSDGASASITDCYLSGETQFCDQNKNCFKIDGLEIKYKN